MNYETLVGFPSIDDRSKFLAVSVWYLAIKLNYTSHLKEDKVIETINQFRYINIQPKTIDLSSRLRGITTEFVGFIPRASCRGLLCWAEINKSKLAY